MKRLLISSGEPAGIGPDLCLQLDFSQVEAQIVIAADPDLLVQRARELGIDISINLYDRNCQAPNQPGQITVLSHHTQTPVQTGKLDPRNSTYVLNILEDAARRCLSGEFDALVTAPVHKGVINDAGVSFSGHTEFLAEKTAARLPVMMLATPGLRVALATTHLPLNQVSAAITRQSLHDVISILNHDLIHQFGITSPRILVCGLNPHAGEGGHLGKEEIETIIPALETLRKAGINLSGPLPADTIFTPNYIQQADAILSMYHDQGLPVLKHIGFGNAVNVTLGLPIIRTSVDHGTALELAGTGKADTGSLKYAIEVACTCAHHLKNHQPDD